MLIIGGLVICGVVNVEFGLGNTVVGGGRLTGDVIHGRVCFIVVGQAH